MDGVYCSNGYLFKRPKVQGLKPHSYFLTLEACELLKQRFETNHPPFARPKVEPQVNPKDSNAVKMEVEIPPFSSGGSTPSFPTENPHKMQMQVTSASQKVEDTSQLSSTPPPPQQVPIQGNNEAQIGKFQTPQTKSKSVEISHCVEKIASREFQVDTVPAQDKAKLSPELTPEIIPPAPIVSGFHALGYQVPVINPKAARSSFSLPNVLPSESKTVSLNVQAQDHLQISPGVPTEVYHPVSVMSHPEPHVVQYQTSSPRQLFPRNSPDSSHSHYLAYSSPGYPSNSMIPQVSHYAAPQVPHFVYPNPPPLHPQNVQMFSYTPSISPAPGYHYFVPQSFYTYSNTGDASFGPVYMYPAGQHQQQQQTSQYPPQPQPPPNSRPPDLQQFQPWNPQGHGPN
jgi:hypothetical protein